MVHPHIINSWVHQVHQTLVPMALLRACILPCPLMVLWVLMGHPMDLLLMGLWDHHISWTEWIQDLGQPVDRCQCLNPIIGFMR